jgi:hypothetical protein
LGGGKLFLPMCGQKMADEWCGRTFDELNFFMVERITEGGWIYRCGTDAGQG